MGGRRSRNVNNNKKKGEKQERKGERGVNNRRSRIQERIKSRFGLRRELCCLLVLSCCWYPSWSVLRKLIFSAPSRGVASWADILGRRQEKKQVGEILSACGRHKSKVKVTPGQAQAAAHNGKNGPCNRQRPLV